MTIWFFGDSWPAGLELGRFRKQSGLTAPEGKKDIGAEPRLAFPAVVERKLQRPVVNCAISASSQSRMIEQFLLQDTNPGDIAIFCCTARTRRMYRTPDGDIFDTQFIYDDTYCNVYEDERVSAQVCTLLYYMSKQRGVTPYFLNLFDCLQTFEAMWDEIPNENWLIPNNQSIISYLFDPEYFSQWNGHKMYNFQNWVGSKCEAATKYILPCDGHPNLVGHEYIADFIIKELKTKGHFN